MFDTFCDSFKNNIGFKFSRGFYFAKIHLKIFAVIKFREFRGYFTSEIKSPRNLTTAKFNNGEI